MLNHRIVLAIAAIFFTTGVTASNVTVTVVNNGGNSVTLQPVSENDKNTLAHARPGIPAGIARRREDVVRR